MLTPSASTIEKRAKLFSSLSLLEQSRIVEAAISNDLRGKNIPRHLGSEGDDIMRSDPARALREAAARSVAAGVCPVLHYCFGRWVATPDTKSILADPDLYDLAVHYLYRLIERSRSHPEGEKLGEGGYSIAYLVTSPERAVAKVPKNLAAQAFAMHEEADIFLACAGTDFAERTPTLLDYDPETGILVREFVAGLSGHDILVACRSCLGTLEQEFDLRDAYDMILEFEADQGVLLDLHPANFIWDEANGRWLLIDLGRVPRIAAEYCSRASFEQYFDAVWIRRLTSMKEVPIRSVQLF